MSIYHLEQRGNADELVAVLGRSESPAVRRRAAEALGDVVDGDESEAVVEELLGVATADADERVRAAAVDALEEIGDGALDRLIARVVGADRTGEATLPAAAYRRALTNDLPEIRMAAASVVGRLGVTEAVPPLLERIDDPDPLVRRRVVRAAGLVGDPRAVEPLAKLARRSRPQIRADVATALGEIGDERALEALLPLASDDDNRVRLAAVKALGEFASADPVPTLLEAFEDDQAAIRRAAALATVELLAGAPRARSHEVRTTVVEALSGTPEAAVTDALVDLFEESTEATQRRNAAWLLGRVAPDERVAIDTLVDALADDDERVRRFAATSLMAMDTPAVEEALIEALDSTFGEGRAMIVFTLGQVGTEAARQRLLALLDEVEEIEIQERTLTALSHLGGT